jgi:hypothetical protein
LLAWHGCSEQHAAVEGPPISPELENILDAILEVFVVAISGGKLVDGANVCGAAAIACAKPFHRKDGRRNLARPCDPGAQ